MQIELSPQEFSKLVIIFLLDKIVNEDEVLPDDDELNKLNELMKSKQLKPHLLKQYLSFDTKNRNYYRRLKDVFYTNEESNKRFTIVINPDKNETNEEIETEENLLIEQEDVELKNNKFCSTDMFYFIKDTVKNVIKRIRKKKVRSPRQIIVDNDIEKIVQKELERRCSQIYGKEE